MGDFALGIAGGTMTLAKQRLNLILSRSIFAYYGLIRPARPLPSLSFIMARGLGRLLVPPAASVRFPTFISPSLPPCRAI